MVSASSKEHRNFATE